MIIMRGMDKKAFLSNKRLPHHLETFDCIAIYANILVKRLKRAMRELINLVYTYQEESVGSKSTYSKYGKSIGGKKPKINRVR